MRMVARQGGSADHGFGAGADLRALCAGALCGLVMMIAACGGGGASDRAVASALVVAGDAQVGPAGQELPAALQLRLLNASGEAVAGQIVNFQVVEGDGSVFVASSLSDAQGEVFNRWTLGRSAGAQTLELRSVDAAGQAQVLARVHATAVAGAPAAVRVHAGDAQAAAQGRALASPLVVEVLDAFGNPVTGVPVSFATADGGTLSPATAHTDDQGLAASVWTLGAAAAPQAAGAQVEGLSAVSFSATAWPDEAGPPSSLTLLDGDQQSVQAHTALPQPVRMVVRNVWGNPLAGVPVQVAAAGGAGYVLPVTVFSDEQGVASWQGYVHTAGDQAMQASVDGVASLPFQVNVLPSAHPLDGMYPCVFTFDAPPRWGIEPGTLVIRFVDGVYQSWPIDYATATLDEGQASIAVTWGRNGVRLDSAIATISVQPGGGATVAGRFNLVVNGFGDGELLGTGGWACTRQ